MRRWLTLPVLGGLLAIYLLVPIVVLLVRLAGGAGSSAGAPGLGAAVWTSVLTATISTGLIALLGVPLAHLLARRRGKAWTALGLAVQLPLALPPLMSGILLIEVVGPYTALGRLFGGRLTDTTAAIVLAQTFVSAPFLIVAARSAFETIDGDLLDVAATLGHDRWSRFLRVSLPVAAPGIRAGLLLAWLRAFGEFGATVILAYHPYSLPVFTFVQFSSSGLPTALPATGVALGAASGTMLLAQLKPGLQLRRWRRRAKPMPATLGQAPLGQAPAPASPARGPLAFELRAAVGEFALELSHRCRSPRLAILGESGAGKTLTLRCLAGLQPAEVDRVELGDRPLSALPSEQRRIGWVPQDGALLPHLDVWQQLTFPSQADAGVAAFWLERLHLTELASRRPAELSGGQRQRVALARALSAGAELLLLDEPLASLDTQARREALRELRRLQRDAGVPTVVVTHDPDEAAALADELIVLGDGQALQAGGSRDLFARPSGERVARLLGIANLRRARMAGSGRIVERGVELDVAEPQLPAGAPVWWCVSPERVGVNTGTEPAHEATVLEVIEHRSGQELELEIGEGLRLSARTSEGEPLLAGERCRVRIDSADISVWARDSSGHGTSFPRVAPAV